MAETVTGLPYCPRCGGIPVLQWCKELRRFRVACRSCQCKTLGYKTIEAAEDAWNKIAGDGDK